MSDDEPTTAELGDLTLESGETLRDARLVYRTHGTLAADGGNAILYPTWFMGTHRENEWLIREGGPLDPARWFVIVPNMIGNGLSSSPSNATDGQRGADFPLVTVRDQVAAQRLLLERLGVSRLQAVIGWSMGALQAYQWAVSHPQMVERIFPFCGSARTSEHNHVFLDGVAAAIRADPELGDAGLSAAATVYAGWGFSQAFYRERLYRELGFATHDEFVAAFWVGMFTAGRDAHDILSMIHTWKSSDVGRTPGFGDDTTAALASIRARTTVLSAEQDLYFTAEDARLEAVHIPGAEFRVIPGIWGHSAGVGLNADDTAFIERALAELLER